MLNLKSSNNIYEEALRAVSSAESDVRYWQIKIDYSASLLSDLQGENGERIADRRRWSMEANGVCDYYDDLGRAYLTADDLRREVSSDISRFEAKLSSAKEVLAEKQAELERVRLFLAEEETRIFPPVVEEEEEDEGDLVF